jgi:serine/threonine protein kinase
MSAESGDQDVPTDFLASGRLKSAIRTLGVDLIGRSIGVYHITSLLGAGGMGEVYRARDTKLGRDVAVKVLPSIFTADPEHLKRFEREARMLAALNHPHIGAIYGQEEIDGLPALVLELVEGPTLAERSSNGPLPVSEALTIARQIAEALEAAHLRGIVHRDLKPANIKVTPDGTVKVLDFGLAKTGNAAHHLSPAATETHETMEGVILGTAAYMSPEQARGRPVDRRTDIWAFGCVLFEMLTGRLAFAGDTPSDTLARVLERDPDWQLLPRSTPARVRDLVGDCLQKDPEKRLNDLTDARREIEACLASPFKLPRAIFESLRWRASRPAMRWGLLGIAVVAAGLSIYQLRDREASLPILTNPRQVTSAVGVEDHPSWSPDARTIAYESSETGNSDIWLAPVGGGSPVNRTADHTGVDRYPSWSPDGRQIAFWSDRDGGGYYVMPALGGAAVRLISSPGTTEHFQSAPEWSADGTQLAGVIYALSETRFQQILEIVSLVTREARQIDLPGIEQARLDLTWSRDGRYVAYVDAGQQQSEVTTLWMLRLSDGRATVLSDGRTNIRRPRWSPDARYLFYAANRAGPTDLWRQRVSDAGLAVGDPQRITTGLEVRGAAFSADGTKLVYSKGRWVSNVWRVPILQNDPATWADSQQITFDQAFVEFVDLSPDGKSLLYSSDRAGNQDLWMVPIGGEALQLTIDPAPDWHPHMSPDGQQITFYSFRTGDREIWAMPASGGAATQLTRSKGIGRCAEMVIRRPRNCLSIRENGRLRDLGDGC